MSRGFARALLGNLSLIAVVVGGIMVAVSVPHLDLALMRDGRLTEFACALFMVALAVAVAALLRFDYLASRGRISTARMPLWLQDANDPR